ncbi:hypothetical protein GCM10010193_15160 [Kitasatospora atroaurantiaca]|uniref:DUF6777 domain-containing protein n=1 Tax=Kitasatospora atroaurantiaca TaxID=285545 RepID=A0A561EIH4_9ACTN|nr:hypothetical protein FB465_0297 [Kitasatospora atroaurantiaca]
MVAGVLAAVLVSQGSSSKVEAAPQVALQPVGAAGPDPFTGSVAAASATPSAHATVSGSTGAAGTVTVQGSEVGLYGGSKNATTCDVPKLAAFLNANPDKGRAWAGVEGIEPNAISSYLRSLTSVVLRADTRVTNHGFSNGAATAYQAVLQAGTAVLVDSRGLPRVRCACGNPLLPPAVTKTAPTYTGTPWPAFKEHEVVVVTPAPAPVNTIVVVDPSSGESFAASVGGGGASGSASPSASRHTTSPAHPGSSAPSSPASGSQAHPSGGSGSSTSVGSSPEALYSSPAR